MRHCHRLLFVTMIAAGLLMPVHAVGQTADASPRTPWGEPDLQGVWSYATLTPLQRLAETEVYTPEEAAARNEAVTRDAPPRPGDVGSYNALWFDRGQILDDRRTSQIVDPPDGQLPVRPDAEERIATARATTRARDTESWQYRTNWDRCLTYHGVPPISTGYNNTYQIVQSPGYVAILVENIHDVRIIPVDGRPALPDAIRLWNGDSRGHWEGDTLVVETANYSEASQHRFPSVDTDPCRRAVHAGEPGRHRLPVHHRGPDRVYAAVDRGSPDAPARRLRHLRVRVSRGELRDVEHPDQRTRRGTGLRGRRGYPVAGSIRHPRGAGPAASASARTSCS